MKWLEMIELRSVECHRELLESQLQQLMHDMNKETDAQAIKIYRRIMLETDLSIHLFHNSKNVERNGSSLGLRLASSLKEFGVVNHSVWTEMSVK